MSDPTSTSFPYPPQPLPVAITGGTGFIGLALARRLLREGFQQIRLVNRNPVLPGDLKENTALQLFSCDLGDLDGLKKVFRGCGAVFHVAAKAGVWGPQEEYERINVQGTANALSAAQKEGVAYFIHTSTPSVVFNRGPFRGEDETLPLGQKFLCSYAETKARAEALILAGNSTDGIKTLALRPHLVWGPGDPHILPRIIQRVKQGRLRPIGSGDNLVDITYVDNAAQAHVAALGALQAGRGAGEAFFISQGQPVILWDWLRDLLGRMELELPKSGVPFHLAYAIGGLAEGICSLLPRRPEPPMTRFVALELAKDHYFNPEKAREMLGYVPEVSIDEGVKRTVEFFVTKS